MNKGDAVSEILSMPADYLQKEALLSWAMDINNKVTFIVAFSGGKDSVAMVLYLLSIGVDKKNIELWHHDVDGEGKQLFDWPCTKSYCKKFAKTFGLKILFSYAKGGILREIYRTNETIQPVLFQKEQEGDYYEVKPQNKERFYNTRRKFPAVSADLMIRWCSWVAKISVMLKGINHSERYSNANIIILTGERRLESAARSNYKEMELYRGASKTRRAIQWRPIIDWTEKEVWEMMRCFSVQPHPCYELGWNRCSCQLCIFSNANTWAAINEISPEKVKTISEMEGDLAFTLYSDKVKGRNVMRDIYSARVEQGVSFIPEEAKKRWLKEALGEFVSNIIIDNWKLPAGAFSMDTAGAN